MELRIPLVPAAYVYLRRGEAVLLQLRQNTGFMDGRWAAAIAGHVLAGEPVTVAAVREADEETGLRLAPSDLTPLTALQRTDGTLTPLEQRIDFFFECRRWEGVPAVREPEKVADMRWFPLGRLPGEMPPHERHVLEALRRGTLRPFEDFGFAGTGRAGAATPGRGTPPAARPRP